MFKKFTAALLFCFILGSACNADIIFSAPDLEVLPTDSSVSFTLEVQFNGTYSVAGVDCDMYLASSDPLDFASQPTEPTSNFVLDNPDFVMIDSLSTQDGYYVGTVAPMNSPETRTNESRALLDVELSLNSIIPGQTYTLFLANATVSDDSGAGYSDVSMENGSISVVPEPTTLGVLGLGAVLISLRHRRRTQNGHA